MNPSPNLFLIGPMGSGKSSIGRRLAGRFRMRFLDLDACIEARTGASVATIFEIEGEAGFRRRESELLAELAAQQDVVLATGGGAVLAPGNRAVLREHGFVAWLDVDVDAQLQRLEHDRQRPLLAAPDRRARLQALARERDPVYRELADLVLPTLPRESCAQATQRFAALLRQAWRRTPATMAQP